MHVRNTSCGVCRLSTRFVLTQISIFALHKKGQKWHDALLALEGTRAFGQVPKQGTVQRWVRDCSLADPHLKPRLLEGILRAGQPASSGTGQHVNRHDPMEALRALEGTNTTAAVALQQSADAGQSGQTGSEAEGGMAARQAALWHAEPCGRIPAPEDPLTLEPPVVSSRVIYSEVADERQPPNHHDLSIHTCNPGTIRFAQEDSVVPHIQRHDMPGVPGGFLMTGILTPGECKQIVAAAECLGYMPDHPVGMPAPTGIDAVEWLADEGLMGRIFNRVRPHLPERLPATPEGSALAGINARWRLFRYGKGAVYRPHIDGSWVGSGVDPKSGKYVHDRFEDRRSKLTFLVYLNDDFEGGATTFYLPDSEGGSGLVARGVAPQTGAVLCFPQGNTASLVHEGSAVEGGKCKYVIRSDVLYMRN
jgi:hypothetical protein